MGVERPYLDQAVSRLPTWLEGVMSRERIAQLFKNPAKTGQIGTVQIPLNGSEFTLDYEILTTDVIVAQLVLSTEEDIVDPMPQRTEELKLQPKQVALRGFRFTYAGDPGFKKVTSVSATRPEFEGRGLGTLLGHLSDPVIEDVIQRLPERFAGFRTFAVIYDYARPNGIDAENTPTGWSSRLAKRMGYVPHRGETLPGYRKNFF